MRNGEAVRDRSRMARADRLDLAFQRTRDPRKRKRALRLKRQVHTNTFRRLSRALLPLNDAFRAAAAGMQRAAQRMGELMQKQRAIVAPPRNPR